MLLEDFDLYGKYGEIILAFFGVTSVEALVDFNPTDDGDEVWSLPETFKVSRLMLDAETADFAIGNIYFGELDGALCVAEQNASPFIFYRRRVD